jgi:phosphonopyruvate decarboxylase
VVDPRTFYKALARSGIDFYTGVPDSLLKSFCRCIAEHTANEKHIIAANEGAAIALASGNYLASGKPALVYMQNSGLGNAINPLLSLADTSVYGIPMIIMIGWRGEPGVIDEPQHTAQGRATIALLDSIGIKHHQLPNETNKAVAMLASLRDQTIEDEQPVVVLVSKNTFSDYDTDEVHNELATFTREKAIELILNHINPKGSVISSTGMISRELYELRDALDQHHDTDFLTIGAMGHCSQIALGVALANQNKPVLCLDGDGAAIMHMGSLAITGQAPVANLTHVILNNGSHDSVGGQPTCGLGIDFTAIAKACGYKSAYSVENESQLTCALENISSAEGSALLDVRIKSGHRADLGRPQTPPQEQKRNFMRYLLD